VVEVQNIFALQQGLIYWANNFHGSSSLIHSVPWLEIY
jgi:hypothetical protein